MIWFEMTGTFLKATMVLKGWHGSKRDRYFI